MLAPLALAPVIVTHDKDEEEAQLLELIECMEARGFSTGELYHEVTDIVQGLR